MNQMDMVKIAFDNIILKLRFSYFWEMNIDNIIGACSRAHYSFPL